MVKVPKGNTVSEQSIKIFESLKQHGTCSNLKNHNIGASLNITEYWLSERATHPEILNEIVEKLGDKWEQHQQHIAGQELADRQLPGLVGIDFNRPFGEYGFAEDLNQIKTRLGRDDYMVFLPKGFDGPFGEKVTQLKINEWQINRIPENTEIDMESIHVFDGGFSFSFCGKQFRYDRFGLELES